MKKILLYVDEYLEEFVMTILLILMAVIMCVQVVSRYAFGMSLSWSEEVTSYMFIWSAFISVRVLIDANKFIILTPLIVFDYKLT